MKKLLSILILFVVCISYLYGCSNETTPQAVGKKINKNLTNLYEAVTNLDTIDNNYIANPDIYQVENMRSTNSTKLINKNISVPNQTQAEKLSFENINDNLDEENNEADIKNTSENENTNEDKIEVIFEEDIDDTTEMKDVLIIDNNGNGTILDGDGNVVEDNSNISNEVIDQIYTDTTNNDEMTNDDKNKVYQFLFENIRYSPRYVTDYNNINAQNSLNNYLYKVQELYTMTADVVEANNVLNDKKDILLISIDNIKSYNNKMIDGNFTPNTQQLVALDNYAQDIKTTIRRIKDCNGQLNNEVNNISTSTSSYGLSKGVDIINSNYLKILNHIDARITYFKSAMATLNQIEFIYKEAELDMPYTYQNDNNSTVKIESNFDGNNTATPTKNIDTYSNNTEEKVSNIDTIINEEKIDISKNNSNIDTFNNNLKNDKINDNIDVVDNIDSIVDNNMVDNYINNNTFDNVLNQKTNLQNHNLPNNTYDINAPTGNFQNGIITQNNLNHGVGNGVNGVYSGYAGSQGNVDYFKQNNMNRTDKNINTYGNNTLIDMINNGTVNNGINTLNISDLDTKPIMVDSTKINDSSNSYTQNFNNEMIVNSDEINSETNNDIYENSILDSSTSYSMS